MRFLLEVESGPEGDPVASAVAARDAGLDGVLLTAGAQLPAPLVTAAAVAGAVDDVLIAAEVAVGDRHPIELAEEAVVVDQAARGRLIVVATPAAGTQADLAEAVDLLRAAWTPRPFRACGPRWMVPAELPEHVNDTEARVRVSPAPFGTTLALWLGAGGAETALAHGLGHLAPEGAADGDLERLWAAPGAAAMTAPRARREAWTGAGELVARLREGRARFGQDWAVVRAQPGAAAAIGREVRPRLQLDRLPEGLEAFWDATPDVL
jgi:hypothetical protein